MTQAPMRSIASQTAIAPLIIGMLMLASAPALAQSPDVEGCTAASKSSGHRVSRMTHIFTGRLRNCSTMPTGCVN